MKDLDRITVNPEIMGGKPIIRGMRITVGTVVDLIARGYSFERILEAYPPLEREDLEQAMRYAAYRVSERDVPLKVA
jgi:uncharacterized protein (DUF433 family)